MTVGPPPICYSCIHKNPGRGLTCNAFPERIPVPILLNEVDHRKPFQGDHDIQFEQDPGRPEPHEFVLAALDSIGE